MCLCPFRYRIEGTLLWIKSLTLASFAWAKMKKDVKIMTKEFWTSSGYARARPYQMTPVSVRFCWCVCVWVFRFWGIRSIENERINYVWFHFSMCACFCNSSKIFSCVWWWCCGPNHNHFRMYNSRSFRLAYWLMRANQAKERMRLDAMKISFGCLGDNNNNNDDVAADDDGRNERFHFWSSKCKCWRSRFKYAPLN